MLSLQNIIIFSFHSLIFYLEIHKHPGIMRGSGVTHHYIYKMNRDEQGGGADQKLEV